jgi:hypothetical protein
LRGTVLGRIVPKEASKRGIPFPLVDNMEHCHTITDTINFPILHEIDFDLTILTRPKDRVLRGWPSRDDSGFASIIDEALLHATSE